MKKHSTQFGTVLIGDIDSIFNHTLNTLNDAAKKNTKLSIGLTGGSTPKAFYKWCQSQKTLSQELLLNTIWSVSDERFVPASSDESNFGTADRLLLTPLGIANDRKLPWRTDGNPEDAANTFSQDCKRAFGSDKSFDICFLGMGDDCHTASIFPQSPLIETEILATYASVKVPEKGWRLTITPYGFSKCGQIIITVTGANKESALRSVFKENYEPLDKPIQLMQNFSSKVTWLIDTAAAGKLFG